MKSKSSLIIKVVSIVILFLFLQSCVVHTRPVVHHPKKIVYVKAPKKHKIIVVKGKRYHYWNGRYHRKTKKGFVVVKL